MGMAYARNLIKAGFEVTGSDVVPERLDLLTGIGGTPAPTWWYEEAVDAGLGDRDAAALARSLEGRAGLRRERP